MHRDSQCYDLGSPLSFKGTKVFRHAFAHADAALLHRIFTFSNDLINTFTRVLTWNDAYKISFNFTNSILAFND